MKTRQRFRLALGVGLLAGCLLTPSGCTRAPSQARKPRALILIVIDTLRGDRTGYSGYAAAVTPTLDSLARRGITFTDAMTPAPLTLPAVSSLLTGRLPFHHGVRDNDRFVLGEAEETLAERFQAAGYRTAAVLGSAVLARDRGLAQGFEVYDDAFRGPYPVYDRALAPLTEPLALSERRADVVTDRALEIGASFGAAPFFLLVHYFDVHMFYDPPPRFRSLHGERTYDGEISFVDFEIGRLLKGLELEDVLVVVVSDHGESNDEHGEPQHGFLLYQSTLRVVALAAGPGVPVGAVRSDLVSLVDFEPTLAGVFDLPGAAVPRDGRRLDFSRSPTRQVSQYAEAFHPLVSYGWSELRSLRKGRWKVIRGAGRTELYDLETDSGEFKNLSPADPQADLAAELERLVHRDDAEAAKAGAMGRSDSGRSEMLEGLGYLGAGAVPRSGPRPHPLDTLPGWRSTQEAKRLFKEAYVRLTSSRPVEALPLLDKALKLDSQLADLWYLRGYAFHQLGEIEKARSDLETCLRLDPEHRAGREELALLEGPSDSPSGQ